jgi:hypothetical protein
MLVAAFQAPLVVAPPDSAPLPDGAGTESRPIEATDGPGRGAHENGARDADLGGDRRGDGSNRPGGAAGNRLFSPQLLTPEQEQLLHALKARDAEVRRHEQAHAAAAGPYGGAARFKYQRGPDGRSYAVGGEVSIDVSPESSPRATVRKMAIVIRAAQAPAEPSAQDRSVANQARQIKQQAEAELRAEKTGRADGAEGAAPIQSILASKAYGRGADLLSRASGAEPMAAPHDRVV